MTRAGGRCESWNLFRSRSYLMVKSRINYSNSYEFSTHSGRAVPLIVFYLWLSFALCTALVIGSVHYLYLIFGVDYGDIAFEEFVMLIVYGVILAACLAVERWWKQRRAGNSEQLQQAWFLREVSYFGAIAFVASVCWLILGAGMYGSPVSGVFYGPTHFRASGGSTVILFAFIFGPMSVLPWTSLERHKPRWGAIGMLLTAVLLLIWVWCCIGTMHVLFVPFSAQFLLGLILMLHSSRVGADQGGNATERPDEILRE